MLDAPRLEAEMRVRLDPARLEEILASTPPDLRPIAHYVAIWGISDDGYRAQLIGSASEGARLNLKRVVSEYDDALDAWLAGPEAAGPDFSEAYIAFSSMRMASDEIR